jgi:hypothetical protein
MDLGFACMQGNSILCSSEVLNSGRQTYHLLPHSKPSGCNWETAQIGTHNMLAKSTATKPPLVDVVGPACTVAAMSAAIVLAD